MKQANNALKPQSKNMLMISSPSSRFALQSPDSGVLRHQRKVRLQSASVYQPGRPVFGDNSSSNGIPQRPPGTSYFPVGTGESRSGRQHVVHLHPLTASACADPATSRQPQRPAQMVPPAPKNPRNKAPVSAASRTVKVRFLLKYKTNWGEGIVI